MSIHDRGGSCAEPRPWSWPTPRDGRSPPVNSIPLIFFFIPQLGPRSECDWEHRLAMVPTVYTLKVSLFASLISYK